MNVDDNTSFEIKYKKLNVKRNLKVNMNLSEKKFPESYIKNVNEIIFNFQEKSPTGINNTRGGGYSYSGNPNTQGGNNNGGSNFQNFQDFQNFQNFQNYEKSPLREVNSEFNEDLYLLNKNNINYFNFSNESSKCNSFSSAGTNCSSNFSYDFKFEKNKKNNRNGEMVNKNQSDEAFHKINLEKVKLILKYIILYQIIRQREKRTTLMIKNIPNKYSFKSLLEEINCQFKNKFDILYLPLDNSNDCNLGFAFINLIDPMHIIQFYDYLRGKKWKKFKSDKICELVFAKVQGKQNLIKHIEKNVVIKSAEEKKPFVISSVDRYTRIEIPIVNFNFNHFRNILMHLM